MTTLHLEGRLRECDWQLAEVDRRMLRAQSLLRMYRPRFEQFLRELTELESQKATLVITKSRLETQLAREERRAQETLQEEVTT